MSLRLPLGESHFATVICAYAPLITGPGKARTKLYEHLHTLLATASRVDKLVVLGDFSARAGADYAAWMALLGLRRIAGCCSNGLLLLQIYTEHRLLLKNTFFTCRHGRRRSGCTTDRGIGS
ncbi:hypothetical protein SprV_0401584200 [Sparganum proliferum]